MARYGSLEVFKFACYLSIPILMTYFIAGNPRNLEAIIRNVRAQSLCPHCDMLTGTRAVTLLCVQMHRPCSHRPHGAARVRCLPAGGSTPAQCGGAAGAPAAEQAAEQVRSCRWATGLCTPARAVRVCSSPAAARA